MSQLQQQFFSYQEYQQQMNHSFVDSYVKDSEQFPYENDGKTIKCEVIEKRFLEVTSKNNLQSDINKLEILKQYRKNENEIIEKLESLGYKLKGIANGGGQSIILSASQNRDIAIKIVESKQNQNETVNNQKEIHNLLNKGKQNKKFIELIEHITLLENWDAFVFKKYKSSLKQECDEYKNGKKVFTDQNMLTFVFDLIHGLIGLRRASIIHLDIKIENILINEQGNLVFCDFGISEIKKQGQLIKCRNFTKRYSPKEQIELNLNDQIDYESDIYSLGNTLKLLIELFIKKNPKSKLSTFAEELLKIINDQTILDDIKQRSNCYEVHSQVYQQFEKIAKDFVSEHQEYFEELKKEIKQYLDLHIDYYFEDIYQNLDQIKDQMKKSVASQRYQNSQNDQNKHHIKRLIQEFEDQTNQNSQSKEFLNKQILVELNFLQERFSKLANDLKKNNKPDLNNMNDFENFITQLSKRSLDLKEHFIKKELSEFQESSNQVLNDYCNQFLELKSKEIKDKENSIQANFEGIVNQIQRHFCSVYVDQIEKKLDDIKKEIKIELILNIKKLKNSIFEIPFQQILQQRKKNIIIDYNIGNISKHLDELKQATFSYSLKDFSIDDLFYLQKYFMEQQSNKKKSLDQQNDFNLNLVESIANEIEQFQKKLKQLSFNQSLKNISSNIFKNFLNVNIDQNEDLIIIGEHLKEISATKRNELLQIVSKLIFANFFEDKNDQINKLAESLFNSIVKNTNILQFPTIQEKIMSFQKALEKYQNFLNYFSQLQTIFDKIKESNFDSCFRNINEYEQIDPIYQIKWEKDIFERNNSNQIQTCGDQRICESQNCFENIKSRILAFLQNKKYSYCEYQNQQIDGIVFQLNQEELIPQYLNFAYQSFFGFFENDQIDQNNTFQFENIPKINQNSSLGENNKQIINFDLVSKYSFKDYQTEKQQDQNKDKSNFIPSQQREWDLNKFSTLNKNKHTSAESSIIDSNPQENNRETQEIRNDLKKFLEIITSNSDLKNFINKLDILNQFRENEVKILQILQDLGYKLEGIINGGGSCLLISASSTQNKNIVIKLFEIKENQNDVVNKEMEIYKLLNEGKKLKHFIEFIDHIKNPQSLLITFAKGLLKIIHDQMILDDIKQRSNCYEVHSQVYQLFKEIPQEFSKNQIYFKELKTQIKQYLNLHLHVDNYFDNILKNLAQIKYEIKKSEKFKEFKNSQNAQNHNLVIQEEKSNQNTQAKKLPDKPEQEELDNFSERFLMFTLDIKKNFDFNLMKDCENFIQKINKSFWDLKEYFIKNELSKFKESSKQVLNDYCNSVLKLESNENKQKADQIQIKFEGIVNKIEKHLSSLQVDEIQQKLDDIKNRIEKRERIQNLKNSFVENLQKQIDEYQIKINQKYSFTSTKEFNKCLIDWVNIEKIAKYLKELKKENETDISYLLKDSSIEDVIYLQNYLEEQQSSQKEAIQIQKLQSYGSIR
ncbi:hypothetical protein ABPG72_017742 [Tetrahymena utriculariae]